jgi:SRSO17 transposase
MDEGRVDRGTLELWAALLRQVKGRMRPLFTQERVAALSGVFLDGLLGEERRKRGWMRADAAGDPGPWRPQAMLGRGRWDAAGMPMRCATLCATMRSNTWRRMTPSWSWTGPVF